MATTLRPKLNRYAIEKAIKIFETSSELSMNEQQFIWLDGVRGLGIRLIQTRVGISKSWVIQARPLDGKLAKRQTLSQEFDLTNEGLENVRLEAQRVWLSIRQGEQQADHSGTVLTQGAVTGTIEGQQCLRFYYEQYILANQKHWGDRHLKDHHDLAQMPGGPLKKRGKTRSNTKTAGPLHEVLELKPRELTKAFLLNWLQRESKIRPGRVALAFRILAAFARWMNDSDETKGLIDLEILNSRLVKREVPKIKPKRRYLTDAQMKPWMQAIFETGNFVSARAVALLFLTGARLNEILELKWTDIDLRYKTWTLKDKSLGTRKLPITELCYKILFELKTHNEYKLFQGTRNGLLPRSPSQFVFFSDTAEAGHITALSSILNKANGLASTGRLSAHDLRRTFSTHAEELGVAQGAIAEFQGHSPSATIERHYKSRSTDALQRLIQPYENWLAAKSGLNQLIDGDTICTDIPTSLELEETSKARDIEFEFASWLV